MKLAVMFNGQAAHFEQMGRDFVTHFEEAKAVYQRAEQLTQLPITKWITEDISALNFTKNAQLAISTTSLAIFNSIKKHIFMLILFLVHRYSIVYPNLFTRL